MRTVAGLLIPFCAGVLVISPLAAQSKPKSSSNVITAEEIERAGPNVGNAFDVVQLLRPRWLRAQEPLGLPDNASGNDRQMSVIRVYLDERDQGDVEYLKTIPAVRIESLRYMSMTEAGARFGPSAGPGIVVTLRH